MLLFYREICYPNVANGVNVNCNIAIRYDTEYVKENEEGK